MRPSLVTALVLGNALSALAGGPQVPSLPEGAKTHWVVEGPEEIVTYLAFDASLVRHRLPPMVRFVTLEELASGGVPWAAEFVGTNPAKARWGVSFLEVIRTQTFSIDGRGPEWPEHGAAALWVARVAPSAPSDDLGPGRPFLAMELWVPDTSYVAYMRTKGYPASYGKVTLRRGPDGTWLGSVEVDGLTVAAACRPAGPVTGGDGSVGMQALFAPPSTSPADVVRVAFAGHREQVCTDDSSWKLHGTHPLAGAVILGTSSFQYGYHLVGGTYPR